MFVAVTLALLAAATRRQAGPESRDLASIALDWLSANEARLAGIADAIWDHPEIYHREFKTSGLLIGELERAGFRVDRGVAALPTAFVASYGSGRPVVGIVTLLDALPGLSQESLATERRPLEPDGPGHGCGHNLIAAADLGAALAVKEAIATSGLRGTIKLFGAPAEEIYHGGVYMVRAGVFAGLDVLLFWHPSSVSTVISESGLAMRSVKFVFTGLPSDATDAAATGRNALSAVESFTRDVDLMRPALSRHTVVNHISHGGTIPSVVPELAEAWYFVHAANLAEVDAVLDRVEQAARQAAMQTSTSVEVQRLSGTHHWLINRTLSAMMHEVLVSVSESQFTIDELRLAELLQRSFPRRSPEPMSRGVLPMNTTGEPVHISDDTADASWIVPRGGFLVACFPAGIASHTWQWTAGARSSLAHKGMLRAARALVLSALRLMTDNETLTAIGREFAAQTADRPYTSPIPADQGPFQFLRLDRR